MTDKQGFISTTAEKRLPEPNKVVAGATGGSYKDDQGTNITFILF